MEASGRSWGTDGHFLQWRGDAWEIIRFKGKKTRLCAVQSKRLTVG